MTRLFWICVMGAFGSGTRYLIGLWATRFGSAFPYGTLIVNLVGCFLLALVLEVSLHRVDFSPTLRLALTTGFLGGLTTYSSFNYETTWLLEHGAGKKALLYVAMTLMGCLVSGVTGMLLARRLFSA